MAEPLLVGSTSRGVFWGIDPLSLGLGLLGVRPRDSVANL